MQELMKAIDRCSSVDELKAAQLSSTQTIGFLDFSFCFLFASHYTKPLTIVLWSQ